MAVMSACPWDVTDLNGPKGPPGLPLPGHPGIGVCCAVAVGICFGGYRHLGGGEICVLSRKISSENVPTSMPVRV